MSDAEDLLAWAMDDFYRLCKAERTKELTGEPRGRFLDSRGIHPYSELWGKIQALRAVLCVEPIDLNEVRVKARAEAMREYHVKVKEGVFDEQAGEAYGPGDESRGGGRAA